jgi:flagella basal body P-ring formation protein FlgA
MNDEMRIMPILNFSSRQNTAMILSWRLTSVLVSALLILYGFGSGLPAQASESSNEKSNEAGVYRIKAQVEVEGDRDIRVSDIVELTERDAALLLALQGIHLADAPGPGEVRTFTDIGLAQLLRAHLPKLKLASGELPTFKIPPRVVVSRKSLLLQSSEIEKALLTQFKTMCADCEFEVSNLSVPVVGKELSAHAAWKLKFKSEMPRGSFSIPLEIAPAPEVPVRMFWVNGTLTVRKNVPVASRSIMAGEKLTANDYTLRTKDVTFATDAPVSSGDFSSSVAGRQISAGEVIWRSSLKRETAIHQGDSVKVVVGSESWQISIDGIAQGAGSVGDQIRVKIPSTQKVVSGLLKEKGLVEVQ